METNGAKPEEIEQLGVGRLRQAVVDGDIAEGSVMAGQSSGLVHQIQPAAEIVRELVEGLPKVIERISQFAAN